MQCLVVGDTIVFAALIVSSSTLWKLMRLSRHDVDDDGGSFGSSGSSKPLVLRKYELYLSCIFPISLIEKHDSK